ncbi:AMP-binding protein [Streptomyces cellulosae]
MTDRIEPPVAPAVLHDAFARWARRTPDALAVVSGSVRLSYAELDRASDGYAADLAAAGVGRSSLVPVLLPRTPVLVAILLAVLKRGAAYAILDPRWPRERIGHVLGLLDEHLAVTGVRPLADALDRGRRPAENPVVDATAASTVFFTSGTTGTPKGVISPHQATTRLFRPGAFADLGPGRVMAVSAATSWDAFTLELWGPLVSGGTAVLSEDSHLVPSALAELITSHGVDSAWLTSSIFNLFVDEDLTAFCGLRQLMIGGERLSPRHVRAFLDAHPEIALTNGYGPVETCVFATTRRIAGDDPLRPDGIPLGTPVPGTGVHVLDGEVPCAPHRTGEICVSGAGLAHGYLHDAALTARKFVEIRLDGVPTRVYRTGDHGYLDEHGVLHFRGRRDRQVKVRGVRVEPQEIETWCESLSGIDKAVAVPVRDENGATTDLALFYVAADPDTTPGRIRERLPSVLPPHCLPRHVVRLAALPLTANGKTDVRALQSMVPHTPSPSAAHADDAPEAADTDGMAAEVERVFRDVLSLPEAEKAENFADTPLTALGGTSLDAMRVCARLQARYGTAITVSRFMREPTLRTMLRLLYSGPAHEATMGATGAEPSGDLPLTGLRAHFCMLHDMRANDPAALCTLEWTVRGSLDTRVLEAALNDVHQRHGALRCAYRIEDGPVAVPDAGPFTVTVQVLRPAPGEDAHSALAERLRRPLRLADGHVWRCVVVPVDDRASLLGIAVHHVAFDGWSQALLVDELSTAYAARLRGEKPVFPHEAPTPAETEAERVLLRDTAEHERQLDYWRETLTGIDDIRFPPPAAVTRPPAGPVGFTLAPAVVARMAATAGELNSTLFLPLVTRFQQAVRTVLRQDDFGIGIPVARRASPRSAQAVGCLIDMVCVRLPVTDHPAGSPEHLVAARETVHTALACQEATFEEVVAALRPARTGRNPLFQVLFAYQNNKMPALRLGSCSADLSVPRTSVPITELSCEVWPVQDGALRVSLVHQPHAVDEDTVRRIAHVYEELLTGETRP